MTPDGWTPGPSPWTLVLWAHALLGAWGWRTGPAPGQAPATMNSCATPWALNSARQKRPISNG